MTLSPEEENVLFNADYLHTKRLVSEKITDALTSFGKTLKARIGELDKQHIIRNYAEPYAKISRGENYGGLPYFMLDYPRKFTTEEVFAFRTMVYWGNHFSFTLHVSGSCFELVRIKLMQMSEILSDAYICVASTPWEYHYEPHNYQLIGSLSEESYQKILNENSFVKISIPYELKKYKNLNQYGLLFFQKIITILN
ncbi:MAG: hypothetical protein WBA74_00290 [Cyclobacteriaceae bacterium]